MMMQQHQASKQFRLQFGMSYIPYTVFACGTFITYLYNTIFVDLINIAYTFYLELS